MKKKILVIALIGALLAVSVYLCADFNTYTDKAKTADLEQSGIIFTITTFDGKAESQPFIKCYGHSWLSIENKTGAALQIKDYEIQDGEILTFSAWAITDNCGVVFNLEPSFIKQYQRYIGRESLSINIDSSKLQIIEDYIDSNNTWTPWKNCSRWSLELWNMVADDNCKLKEQTMIYTPKRLQKSINEFDCVEYDKDFSDAKGVFWYKDGVRTELELCS